MKKIFDKSWNAKEHEEKIYENWEESGYFKPEINLKKQETVNGKQGANKKPFVIPIPPPNVTGKLHIGHAMFVTLEDIMTRYHRLKGEPTLWIPGTDHAGIATQTVVEKDLKKKGIRKHDLGREKFVEKVWQWKEEHGGEITRQIRRLGASCDWSRERFTLDEGLSDAVVEAFSRLHKSGLIYRGKYIVNWCTKCHSAISDDEVLHTPKKSKLYYFKYDKNFPITIATTRPETKLGDTAVAVNPKDDRYKEMVGNFFDIDLDGVKRKIKIIADRTVDPEFGAGALGVTPAHSTIDWKMAEDNKLEVVQVIGEDGKMTHEAGKYAGLSVKEAQEKVINYLREFGLMEKEEEIENNLSVCYRCNASIEPIPSKQWFVKMKPLAEKAVKAVKGGEVKIIPKRFEKTYFHWMDNIKDWCISRQLWWGHRIPVWYKQDAKLKTDSLKLKATEEEIFIGKNPPSEGEWVQDPDVLDTWFSSGLWPFSTLGWPEETEDLKNFYPTSVLETGYDILFFWVARMIMMGIELTGKPPFHTVYLHGLVRDEHNRKMSKSLGNVLDPLDVIAEYGTDALRMGLTVGATPGQDVAVGKSKIKGYRNFANKIWNASRFVALRVTGGDLQSGELGENKIEDLDIDENLLTDADKEIQKAHHETIEKVTKHLDEYRFSLAGETVYDYFWHTFADKYIESAKSQLEDEKLKANTQKILIKVLTESLVLLHPFVPYVTEQVWQELREIYPALSESIMISDWPK